MRLTDRQVKAIKNGGGYALRDVMNLCDTIEAQQKEIQQLQAQKNAMMEVDKQKDVIIHQCFLTLQMCRVDGLSVDADFLAEQAILEIEKLGKVVEK
jgi:hypothetical protein